MQSLRSATWTTPSYTLNVGSILRYHQSFCSCALSTLVALDSVSAYQHIGNPLRVDMVYPAFIVPYLPRVRRRLHDYLSMSFSSLTREDLREIYTITTPPDIPRATASAAKLCRDLAKYLSHRPIAAHTQRAFEGVLKWHERHREKRPLVFDAGCGTGRSTIRLARMLPAYDVVGIDRSEERLDRTEAYRKFRGLPEAVENALLVRAELADFWRLCLNNKVWPEHQFILYPNPYPKYKSFKLRWHGHPVFPIMVALGGRVEVRASWAGYLREFGAAFEHAHASSAVQPLRRSCHCALILSDVQELDFITPSAVTPQHQPLSNFEEKYVQVRRPIYRLCLDTRPEEVRAACKLPTL